MTFGVGATAIRVVGTKQRERRAAERKSFIAESEKRT
jgi:hypothetical protein